MYRRNVDWISSETAFRNCLWRKAEYVSITRMLTQSMALMSCLNLRRLEEKRFITIWSMLARVAIEFITSVCCSWPHHWTVHGEYRVALRIGCCLYSTSMMIINILVTNSNSYLQFSRPLLLGYPLFLQILDLISRKSQKLIIQHNRQLINKIITSEFLTTSPAPQMRPKLAQKLATHTLSELPTLPTDQETLHP